MMKYTLIIILFIVIVNRTSQTNAAISGNKNQLVFFNSKDINDSLVKKNHHTIITDSIKALDYLLPAINAGLMAAGIVTFVNGLSSSDNGFENGICLMTCSGIFSGILFGYYFSKRKKIPAALAFLIGLLYVGLWVFLFYISFFHN